MSFWGKLGGALKGIGKVALKAAPVAAAFIPGIGPLAAMGIGAATNAASKKLSGGSWGQALGAGALGAGTSALSGGLLGKIGAKLGGGGGGFVNNAVKGVEQQALGGGLTGNLGNIFSAMKMAPMLGGGMPNLNYGGGQQYTNPMMPSFMPMGMPSGVGDSIQQGWNLGQKYSPIKFYNPPTSEVAPDSQGIAIDNSYTPSPEVVQRFFGGGGGRRRFEQAY